MNVKREITLNWDDAPDTITPEIYARIRGHSNEWARKKIPSIRKWKISSR